MWYKDERYINVYHYKYLTYRITIEVETLKKSVRYFVLLSSGKKRKQLDIYEQKSQKTNGNLKNLKELYNIILSFDKYYNSDKKTMYCINWSDSRRRKIYERLLLNKGWIIRKIDNYDTLILTNV